MLHLFKEIYANYDTNVNIKYYRVVISEANGYPIDASMDLGNLLHYAQSFDDLIGMVNSLVHFLTLSHSYQISTTNSDIPFKSI